jgi:hypothetical protein
MACANSNAAAVTLGCIAAHAPISKADARATTATGNFIARYIWQLSRSKS